MAPIQSSISGFTGFFTTLITSRLVDAIQKNGSFFGLQVYAQQVVSAIGVIMVIVILIYLNTAFRGMKSKKE